jgi:hypothetical protein
MRAVWYFCPSLAVMHNAASCVTVFVTIGRSKISDKTGIDSKEE